VRVAVACFTPANTSPRPTSCRSSLAPRSCCSSSPRRVSSTLSPHPSCSHSSPSPRARTSSRYAAPAPPYTHPLRRRIANHLQACLNAPEPATGDANGVDADNSVESPEDNHAQVPPGQPRGMPPNNPMQAQAYMTPEAALQYQNYLQGHQQSHQYPMAQQAMPRHPSQHYPQDQKLG
jgi:hypothetical protein